MASNKVVLINRKANGKFFAVTAGFPVNYVRARYSTAVRDAEAIAANWRKEGYSVEIRDFTQEAN